MPISPSGNARRSGRKTKTLSNLATIADVARIFGVLSEPTRLQILQVLGDAPHHVTELVERLGAKQANVSKQLGVLHQAGLVGRERQGSQVRYFVAEPMVFDLCTLVCAKIRRDAEAQIEALADQPRPPRRPGG